MKKTYAYFAFAAAMSGCATNPAAINQFGLSQQEAAYLHNGTYQNSDGTISGVLFTKVNGTTLNRTAWEAPIKNVFMVPAGKSTICLQINNAKAFKVERNVALLEADLKATDHYRASIESSGSNELTVYIANDRGEAASTKIKAQYSENVILFGAVQASALLSKCD